MLDPLPIVPFTRPACGAVALPGSKSITNRALVLAALSDRAVTLNNALFSEDTRLMIEALRALGFGVETDEPARGIRIAGRGTQGVIVFDTAEDERVGSVEHIGDVGEAEAEVSAAEGEA